MTSGRVLISRVYVRFLKVLAQENGNGNSSTLTLVEEEEEVGLARVVEALEVMEEATG